ncbi:polysaccharide lyase family 7 protein [Pseudomonas sp. UBA4194]|jgi:hypothetical protein|uniref:polysaccharide lyase family 7 protein n=1 Tax=Pseudomonas sp. UBA4194 TaxID=1947317 RepID=UPI0025F6F10E|nr:polysaccharide lyase family 7 protein [Pseudomonas sp. UBA4194]
MIDLAVWNLSIPVGSPPKTIETPQLKSGYKDKYFDSGSGSLFFWAPVTGSKTANAKYPRTELRETFKDGELRNWKYPEADNSLKATLLVSKVPSSGKIVIGQIHAYESTKPMLKLEYQYSDSSKAGNIVAKLRKTPGSSEGKSIIIAKNVPLNVKFKYEIHLSKSGALGISARDQNLTTKVGSSWKNKLLYFKAGVYTQDNTGYTSEGGRVTFYALKVRHAG